MMKTVRCKECFRSFTYEHRRGLPRTRCDEHRVVAVKKVAPDPEPTHETTTTPEAAATPPARPISAADREANAARRKANAARARGASVRRRGIDPTTCEIEYTADELEFHRAMDKYKRDSGRQFPTLKEVLEVVRSIGYRKADSAHA